VATRPHVLVFAKKPAVFAAGKGPRAIGTSGLPKGGAAALRRLEKAARDHKNAISRLRSILKKLSTRSRFVFLPAIVDPSGYDLVIALGGDGTVLHASHQLGREKVLAINSAPRHSVGFLTTTTIGRCERAIRRALSGELEVTRLQRMAIDIDGRRAYSRVLNDVLFSHECPASTARYRIGLDKVRERQTSSGIWAGPAAGSTAAQLSAGGRVLPPRSRQLQFVVREPYGPRGKRYALVKGLVKPGHQLAIESATDAARLYVDGPHVVVPVRFGETVSLKLSEEPLSLLGFERFEPR